MTKVLNTTFSLSSKVWLYTGEAAWHFVTLPKKESEYIQMAFEGVKRGWGSLRVRVKIREVEWETSIFPDKKRGGYLLPLKADIRKKLKIHCDEILKYTFTILQ